MFAQQGSDGADDTGRIQVGEDNEFAVEMRFDLDSIEASEARRCAVEKGATAITEPVDRRD